MKVVAFAAYAAALLLFASQGASAFRRSMLQECKAEGSRCSLYASPSECCPRTTCTMPLECTSVSNRGECKPECRNQTLDSYRPVTFRNSYGNMTPGFEVGKKSKPAVVVMQEWWGVNAAIRDFGMHVAEQGYRVLIPDLYRGRVALSRMEAIGLQSDLNWTRGVNDVVAAVDYLRATGSKKVAIVGFCQGGGMAYCGAQLARVDAAVPFYGIPPANSPCNPLLIPKSVPVQAHYGTLDASFPPSRVLPLVGNMTAAGVNIKLFMYEGLPHAFLNTLTPEGRALFKAGNPTAALPNEELVTLAFSRFTNFLRQTIRH